MRRSSYLRRQYGITSGEYKQLLVKQNNRCAICGQSKELHVDHNHVNGRVRSLLCLNCNVILGHAHDSVEILLKAADYMKRHSEIDSDDDPKLLAEKLRQYGF